MNLAPLRGLYVDTRHHEAGRFGPPQVVAPDATYFALPVLLSSTICRMRI